MQAKSTRLGWALYTEILSTWIKYPVISIAAPMACMLCWFSMMESNRERNLDVRVHHQIGKLKYSEFHNVWKRFLQACSLLLGRLYQKPCYLKETNKKVKWIKWEDSLLMIKYVLVKKQTNKQKSHERNWKISLLVKEVTLCSLLTMYQLISLSAFLSYKMIIASTSFDFPMYLYEKAP